MKPYSENTHRLDHSTVNPNGNREWNAEICTLSLVGRLGLSASRFEVSELQNPEAAHPTVQIAGDFMDYKGLPNPKL